MGSSPHVQLVILASGDEPVAPARELEGEDTALVLLQLVLLSDGGVHVEQLYITRLHPERGDMLVTT